MKGDPLFIEIDDCFHAQALSGEAEDTFLTAVPFGLSTSSLLKKSKTVGDVSHSTCSEGSTLFSDLSL